MTPLPTRAASPAFANKFTSRFGIPMKTAVALLCAVAGAVPVWAQELQATPPSEITAALQPFVDNHIIAGCVALVATKDKLLCLEPVGYADMETKKPMQANTLFAIASMTKAHSCAAYMTLVDEGKLKTSDLVEKYLPEYKGQKVGDPKNLGGLVPASHPITIKDCLTHTAGFPAKAGQNPLYRRKYVTLKEDAAAVGKVPLDHQPGTKYEYSMGIDVVGGVIEAITGMKYADFMQKRLFDPMGMKDATFFPNQEQAKRLAHTVKQTSDKKGIENHNANPTLLNNGVVPKEMICQSTADVIERYKNRYGVPSGGLVTSAEDVMKLMQMLLNNGEYNGKCILSPAAVKEMTSNQIKGIGKYGYGLETVDVDGQFSAGSFSHRGARSTMMWADKKKGLVLVLLLQYGDMPKEQEKKLYDTFVNAAFAKYAHAAAN